MTMLSPGHQTPDVNEDLNVVSKAALPPSRSSTTTTTAATTINLPESETPMDEDGKLLATATANVGSRSGSGGSSTVVAMGEDKEVTLLKVLILLLMIILRPFHQTFDKATENTKRMSLQGGKYLGSSQRELLYYYYYYYYYSRGFHFYSPSS